MELGDLGHHRLIDGQAARGVDQQHIVIVASGPVGCCLRDGHWGLAWVAGEEVGPCLRCDGSQLLDGRWPVDVAGDGEHLLFVPRGQPSRELAHTGGLARTLQAGHEHNGGWLLSQVQARGASRAGLLAGHELDQLPMNHTHQRLPGGQAVEHLLAEGLLANRLNKPFDNWQRNVGLEQRETHFTQHLGGVRLGEAGLSFDGLECAGESVGKAFQHAGSCGPALHSGPCLPHCTELRLGSRPRATAPFSWLACSGRRRHGASDAMPWRASPFCYRASFCCPAGSLRVRFSLGLQPPCPGCSGWP